eukprot:snap_masked-scaffold_13-processed-gene-3.34-mRNA-1 protein AED:0.95 eAED:1.00 QI:0/-1/0/1/-1/1/1/0/136
MDIERDQNTTTLLALITGAFIIYIATQFYKGSNSSVHPPKESPVHSLLGSARVEFAQRIGDVVALVLKHPEVHSEIEKAIADGINRWIKDPETELFFQSLVNSDTPKDEVAKELGKQLPGVAKNFASGVFSGLRGN